MRFLFDRAKKIPKKFKPPKVEKSSAMPLAQSVTKVRGKMHTRHIEEAAVKAMKENIDVSSTGTKAPGIYEIELPKGSKKRFGSVSALSYAVAKTIKKHAQKKKYQIAYDIEVKISEKEHLDDGTIVVKTEMKDVEDKPKMLEIEKPEKSDDEIFISVEPIEGQPDEDEEDESSETEEEFDEETDKEEPIYFDEPTLDVIDEPTIEEPRLATLTFTNGKQVGYFVEIAQWETSIGRTGDIQVIDPRKSLVSRKHALLKFDPESDKYEIEDTSKHGTAVNSELLGNGGKLLNDGDKIQLVHLGGDRFLVEMKIEYQE